MSSHFKIAVLQARSGSGCLEENTDTIIANMKCAAEQNADLLLLPECFITGYDILPVCNEDVPDADNCYIDRIRAAAKKLRVGVIATALTKGIKKPRNSAYVIDKNGSVLMRYDKVHTCDFSYEACLEHGSEFKVCDFHGIRIGIMICYDREYPESARILMLKGAEIILVPNDCSCMRPRVQALSTRAYENMTGIVMANPPGDGAGCSCAFSPVCWDDDGHYVDNTVFLAEEHKEGIFTANFDMDILRHYREEEMMGNTFRKPEAYSDLLSTEIRKPFIRTNSPMTPEP